MVLPRATVAVLLPGTGSDATFAESAFGPALQRRNIAVHPVSPDPRRVVASYLEALDRAAERHGRILVGGISIGAAVALRWTGEQPGRVAGVLAALPAWTGAAGDAPAALSARATARQLRIDGLAAVTERMRASSPAWLAETLSRSWAAQWPHLPDALDEAADYPGPTVAELRRTETPCGIAAATDDPVHPSVVAEQWARLLPHAMSTALTLTEIGADPAALGHACLAALDRLAPHLGAPRSDAGD
ncbi:alpha/beta fold hydrolase [Skermania piniformis]|uniref:alpha/beta fold hydrolase n=1 Tax=Skermania pinensis TaxID=39122 RepID=UPI0012EEDB3D|nr:alpha/beta fold hydrolase [Skermania piniformis]